MPPSANPQNSDVFGPSDRAQMIRLTDAMERLANVTDRLSIEFDQLKDGRIMELLLSNERTNSRINVSNEKVERLERIVYGIGSAVALNAVAVVAAIIQMFVGK